MSSQPNTKDSIMFVSWKHIFILPMLCVGVRIATKIIIYRVSLLTSKFIKQRSIDHNAPKGKSRSSGLGRKIRKLRGNYHSPHTQGRGRELVFAAIV